MPITEDKIFYDYLIRMIGIPYKWTGNNPIEGFDCSGLVCEALRSQGLVGHNEDLKASDLYVKFGKSDLVNIKFGTLLFFGKDISTITHVTIALTNKTMIEAGGGTSQTLSWTEAMKANAFVKISPISRRKDLVGCSFPSYRWLS